MPLTSHDVRLAAAAVDVDLDPAQGRLLAAYVAALIVAGADVNVTAATDADDALRILVAPSLCVERAWPPERWPPALALDLGSGNGFPGVGIAVRWDVCRR